MTDATGYVAYPLVEARTALEQAGLQVEVRYTVDPHRSPTEVGHWAVLAVRPCADGSWLLVAGAVPEEPPERTDAG